jgi:hypothetical protein
MKLPALFDFRGSPEFTTDGCSGYISWAWFAVTGHAPPMEGACIIHDLLYWSGGTRCETTGRMTRAQADAWLFDVVRYRGSVVGAWIMWIGCRVGGSQYLPFAWRWRYREPYWDVLRGRNRD